MTQSRNSNLDALEKLQSEMIADGRLAEAEALAQVIASQKAATPSTPSTPSASSAPSAVTSRGSATGGARLDGPLHAPSARTTKNQSRTFLKLKKKYYTPAEVARRVGVSRQTIVKWIERGELEAELTPGGHHRIPASVFHREGRGEAVQLIPADETK